jgi:hypothetical protein
MMGLANQTVLPHLIVIDYGSDEEYLEQYRLLFNDSLIETGIKSKYFNISYCNNLGIRLASTELVMTGGIDLVFSERVIETYEQVMAESTRNIVGVMPIYLSKEGKPRWTHTDWACCVCWRKSWLLANGGYDERYEGWGYEDTSIKNRAKNSGLNLVQAPDCYAYHLWHPRGYIDNQQINKNRLLWAKTHCEVKTNDGLIRLPIWESH